MLMNDKYLFFSAVEDKRNCWRDRIRSFLEWLI